jgi:hypothetical protein
MGKPDLKAESKKLGDLMAKARKSTHQVAILMNGSELVVEADRKKSVKKMRAAAKAKGGGSRGACGQMRFDGKTMLLTCEDEPPGGMERQIKKHFSDRNLKISVEISVGELDKTNIEADEDENDPEAADAKHVPAPDAEPNRPNQAASEEENPVPGVSTAQDPELAELEKRFLALKPDIVRLLNEEPVNQQLLNASKAFKLAFAAHKADGCAKALDRIEAFVADGKKPSPSKNTEAAPKGTKSPVIQKLKTALRSLKDPLEKAFKVGGAPAKACKAATIELAAALKASDASRATKTFADLRKAMAEAESASNAAAVEKAEMKALVTELIGLKSSLKGVLSTGDPLANVAKSKLREFHSASKQRDLNGMKDAVSTLRLAMRQPSSATGDRAGRVSQVKSRVEALKAKIAKLTMAMRDNNAEPLNS